jgi:CDP-alcohol phosphatidyltransferase
MKKDEANNYYTILKRKTGVLLTWIILKLFPTISANTVTISMLPLNLLAAGIIYYAIVWQTPVLLFISFLVSFYTLVLDSVDGNIARIKNTTSIKGVYLDRLIHNICHPLFFFVIGFALYEATNQIGYLIIFMVVGLLSELSPFDISQKDVEALFIRQAVYQKTSNYNIGMHPKPVHRKKRRKRFLLFQPRIRKWITTLFMNDFYYVMILLDFVLLDMQYYVTVSFAVMDIVAMIYVRAYRNSWEDNLREVLKRLTVTKNERT